MTCVELKFSDDQRRLDARPAHRRRLVELHERGDLLAAGPWDDDSGALLIFRLDESSVRQELELDPYYRTSGVELLNVRPWSPVVGA